MTCVPLRRGQSFDFDVAELNRILMPQEPETPFLSRRSGMLLPVHWSFGRLRNVRIENLKPVEIHGEMIAVNGHLLEIPLTHRPQITDVCGARPYKLPQNW